MSATAEPEHATPALAEAARLMVVCNSCRYCEGLCAVFPAMEMRTHFADADLDYLANLCHGCGACYHDCQFAPPHAFNVNVPAVLAEIRGQSYARYAWPGVLRRAFAANAAFMAAAAACSSLLFLAGFAAVGGLSVPHRGPGAFYAWMSHDAMALAFGGALLLSAGLMAAGVRGYLHGTGSPPGTLGNRRSVWQGLKDAASLRYLDGGGMGCFNADERPSDRRRLYHHLTAYGFLLCLASTSTATLYHYIGGWEAPYAWWDLPVALGAAGGAGLVTGTAGLFAARLRRDPALGGGPEGRMGLAFTGMLFATGATGLLLLGFRATPAMGTLLAVHLGVVLALFVTMPYGKFVHGLYRLAALIRAAGERPAG